LQKAIETLMTHKSHIMPFTFHLSLIIQVVPWWQPCCNQWNIRLCPPLHVFSHQTNNIAQYYIKV